MCIRDRTVAHANLITGAKIPEEKTRILRNVISDKLSEEGKTVAIGACVYYKDCALRVDSMREGMVDVYKRQVYAGSGCISTQDTIRMSKEAEKLGADVLSIITPSFAVASQKELYDHYVCLLYTSRCV